jgi:hypothetical protein
VNLKAHGLTCGTTNKTKSVNEDNLPNEHKHNLRSKCMR